MSKLVSGVFNNLEPENPTLSVVYLRKAGLGCQQTIEISPTTQYLTFLVEWTTVTSGNGSGRSSFTLVFYSHIQVRDGNVPLLPTINSMSYTSAAGPSPIRGFERAAGGGMIVGTSDIMAIKW